MTNQDLFKQDDFRQQYALAKEIGDKRFGSECKHTETKGGYCTNCLRKVVSLTGLFREPCHRCHLVQTYGRDQHNLPLCQGCAEEEAIWQAYEQAEHAPVILDEYCWMHTPGNWDCIQCYREQQQEEAQQ